MSHFRKSYLAVLASSVLIYPVSASEGARPNALSLEFLGRGLRYSVNYDRAINDSVAVGAGVSYLPVTSESDSSRQSVYVFPLYGNYYFNPSPHRGFLTGGVELISMSPGLSFQGLSPSGNGFMVIPTIGGGYEYRSLSGFLFRVSPYLSVMNTQVGATIGLSFGGTF